ncbi:MAG: cytochrome c oxidase subunit 3 [Bacteroidetes bacterium]|nr:cytochrome c oxidase subunit 3 [Bacteroidota bacterium]
MDRILQPAPASQEQYTVHPKKLMLWIAIVGICMMFAGLTSAFIVKKGDPKGWVNFQLPSMFFVTTLIVLLSSGALWISNSAAKNDEINKSKWATLVTLLLGITFCIGQFMAWGQMVDNRMFFSGDSAAYSFIYVLSGLHLAHIAAGLIALGVLYYKTTNFQVHKKNMISMQLVSTYWHFVGVLWIFLYIFLTIA